MTQCIFNFIKHLFIILYTFYAAECSCVKMSEIYTWKKCIIKSAKLHNFRQISKLICLAHCFRTEMNTLKALFHRLFSGTGKCILCKLQCLLTAHFGTGTAMDNNSVCTNPHCRITTLKNIIYAVITLFRFNRRKRNKIRCMKSEFYSRFLSVCSYC